ncbi:MAG: right-handed parallel beta-helix repeat-containing protein [Candidatus Hodarchaeales archaeon]
MSTSDSTRTFFSITQTTPHKPVIIDGNEEFQTLVDSKGWKGDGTRENPFIIENLVIDNTTDHYSLRISNTDTYFRVRNCYFTDGHVSLERITNGQFSSNTLINTTLTLWHSEHNALENNNVINNISHEGLPFLIELIYSEHNTVSFNEIINNAGGGIQLYYSGHSTFSSNIIDSSGEGMFIRYSGNNIIKNNIIKSNNGFSIIGDDLVHWLQAEVVNNSINNKPLIYWQGITGETISNDPAELVFLVDCMGITIENQEVTGIVVTYSSYITISSNTIIDGKNGIYLEACQYTSVFENTLSNHAESGIKLFHSEEVNTVDSNILINNSQGISLEYVINCKISKNTIKGGGINLWESGYNRIVDNILIGNGLFIDGGDHFHLGSHGYIEEWDYFRYDQLLYYPQTMISNNTVNGRPLIYWDSITGATVPSGAGQIILANCHSIQVIGQNVSSIIGIYCWDLLIQVNLISSSDYGLLLLGSSGSSISDNSIHDIRGDGIILTFSENDVLTGNTVTNNQGKGIQFYYSQSSALTNNTIMHNDEDGIYLAASEDCNLTNNFVAYNRGKGIFIDQSGGSSGSPRVKLDGNFVINNNDGGIGLYNSGNSRITNNTVKNNGGIGISIDCSKDNVIKNNQLENNTFDLDGWELEHFSQTEVTNNSIDGKPLIYWYQRTNEPIPKEVGQLILINCTSIEVMDLNVMGILGVNCSNLTIQNNDIARVWDGIRLQWSYFNTISFNTVTNIRGNGIHLIHSENNVLMSNYITTAINEGILVEGYYMYGDSGGGNNILINNTVSSCGRGIAIGRKGKAFWDVSPAINCTLINNTVIYNKGTGISLITDSSSLYRNFIAYNDERGVEVLGSPSCKFGDNVIAFNGDYGMFLVRAAGGFGTGRSGNSFYNIIFSNAFYGNNLGNNSQALDDESFNSFSHNYWDDWTEPDVDKDGFVDVPYLIDGKAANHDSHPLVSPPVVGIHLLIPPKIIFPNGREILSNSTIISWIPAFDTLFHDIKYSIYYSPDAGTSWILLADNLVSNELTWNIGMLSPGANYVIRVNAYCSTGSIAYDISDEPFSIISTTSTTPQPVNFSLFPILLALIFINYYRKKSYRRKRIK